jgi:hypothetical protein
METWSQTICCLMSCSNRGRHVRTKAVEVHMPPWGVAGMDICLKFGPRFMAKVNEHPWMHQLVILPMGWATFSHLIPNPALTHITPQSTFFGCWPLIFILSWSFFWVNFFAQPWLISYHLPPIYPSHIGTLLTYILALPINYCSNPLFTHPT